MPTNQKKQSLIRSIPPKPLGWSLFLFGLMGFIIVVSLWVVSPVTAGYSSSILEIAINDQGEGASAIVVPNAQVTPGTIQAAPVSPVQTEPPQPVQPTRTRKPTATPVPIPPPSNPNSTRMMIGFGVIAVIVVIIGVWINRRRTF